MTNLAELAKAYTNAKRAQEQDHTSELLNWQRSEAHDALILALDAAGVAYADREHAGRIAAEIVAGTFVVNGVLDGNGDGANVDARFLELLARYYTVAMVEGWIDRAAAGMRTRTGQTDRWRRTLEWLKT